jgi:methylenetetrahydrofolate reductase (NADPH)
MPENYLRSALEEGRFFCSAELVLGRDHSVPDAEKFVNDAAHEENGIRVISLTDLPSGNPALPPESFVSFILERGLTPLPHLTGKDGNRSFIESRLHSLARIGVENILALTGDAQKSGFHGQAKPVYDLDSVLMLWLIQAATEGIEYNLGKRTIQTTPFDFFPGAVVNPFKVREADQMMQLYKLRLKVSLGARFIITQLGFNLRKLYEVKQYMVREGLGTVPLVANVYVPTAVITKMMKRGDIAGCSVSDGLIAQLGQEKKPERMERAALMVAAARDLGFAGAHIGGFGLSHQDFLAIIERSGEIGKDWKNRVEELIFELPGEFYLFPEGENGLSDGNGDYQVARKHPKQSFKQKMSNAFHRHFVDNESFGARFLARRLEAERERKPKSGASPGFWHKILGLSTLYREAALGCVSCGDCIQDHLGYAGCTMRWCYKNLRNGPCGGSRVDGSCEADPDLTCIWNLIYLSTVGSGEDPEKFAQTLIPPRDWCLDRTNALANRLVGLDNECHRVKVDGAGERAVEG